MQWPWVKGYCLGADVCRGRRNLGGHLVSSAHDVYIFKNLGWRLLVFRVLGIRFVTVFLTGVCFTTCYASWHRLLSRWEREWVYPEKRNLWRLQSRGIRPVSPPCQEKDALAQHQGCLRKPFLTCSRLLDWFKAVFLKTFIMPFCRVPVCLKPTLFVTEVTVRTAGIP